MRGRVYLCVSVKISKLGLKLVHGCRDLNIEKEREGGRRKRSTVTSAHVHHTCNKFDINNSNSYFF